MTKRGDEVAPVGKIGKAVFKHFAESECARQLFLDLGEGDPAWIAPYREVIKNEVRRGNTTRVELGSAYERSVYAVLLRNPRTRASETYNPDEPVKKVDLTPASLRAYAALLNTPGGPTSLYLLEHGCPTPPSFVRYLFDLGPDAPWPVKADKQTFYPDIVVLRRVVPTDRGDVTLPVAVMPDASLRTLTEQEALDRTALELIDIKHTHEQGVGATHFIELHYYLRPRARRVAARKRPRRRVLRLPRRPRHPAPAHPARARAVGRRRARLAHCSAAMARHGAPLRRRARRRHRPASRVAAAHRGRDAARAA